MACDQSNLRNQLKFMHKNTLIYMLYPFLTMHNVHNRTILKPFLLKSSFIIYIKSTKFHQREPMLYLYTKKYREKDSLKNELHVTLLVPFSKF